MFIKGLIVNKGPFLFFNGVFICQYGGQRELDKLLCIIMMDYATHKVIFMFIFNFLICFLKILDFLCTKMLV